MLRQLITTVATRPTSATPARLQPAELQAIIESLPEVARVMRARRRASMSSRQPRSVCTTLKDLYEF
jgi:hypothetical protein